MEDQNRRLSKVKIQTSSSAQTQLKRSQVNTKESRIIRTNPKTLYRSFKNYHDTEDVDLKSNDESDSDERVTGFDAEQADTSLISEPAADSEQLHEESEEETEEYGDQEIEKYQKQRTFFFG